MFSAPVPLFSSVVIFFICSCAHLVLLSFPTRRSSDLSTRSSSCFLRPASSTRTGRGTPSSRPQDRKSTRLNSSHVSSSYAVFCLKKKIDAHLTSHLRSDFCNDYCLFLYPVLSSSFLPL